MRWLSERPDTLPRKPLPDSGSLRNNASQPLQAFQRGQALTGTSNHPALKSNLYFDLLEDFYHKFCRARDAAKKKNKPSAALGKAPSDEEKFDLMGSNPLEQVSADDILNIWQKRNRLIKPPSPTSSASNEIDLNGL